MTEFQKLLDAKAKEAGWENFAQVFQKGELTFNVMPIITAAAHRYAEGGKWISVKDKLPDERQQVLCFASGERIFTAICVNRGFLTWDEYEECELVTHWQPLPQPPTI